MRFESVPVLKQDEKGIVYDFTPHGSIGDMKVKCIEKYEGSVSGGHTHAHTEQFYLIQGHAQVTIGDESRTVHAPARMTVEPNQIHIFKALTDFILLEYVMK